MVRKLKTDYKPNSNYWRKKADQLASQIVRDIGHCEVCGQTKSLNCHHILSKTNYPHLRHLRINLMCVCVGCHIFRKCAFHQSSVWAGWWLMKNKPEVWEWAVSHLEDKDIPYDFRKAYEYLRLEGRV